MTNYGKRQTAMEVRQWVCVSDRDLKSTIMVDWPETICIARLLYMHDIPHVCGDMGNGLCCGLGGEPRAQFCRGIYVNAAMRFMELG